MNNLFIKEKYLDELLGIFKNYCPKAEIWAYGSRLNGDAHGGSDLDLAVKDFNDENSNIFDLRQILNDSNIPFLIDIFELEKLPLSFQDEIKKNYMVIFPFSD